MVICQSTHSNSGGTTVTFPKWVDKIKFGVYVSEFCSINIVLQVIGFNIIIIPVEFCNISVNFLQHGNDIVRAGKGCLSFNHPHVSWLSGPLIAILEKILMHSKKLLPNIPRSKPSIRAKISISSCNEVTFHFVPFCSFGNTKFIA